MEPYYISDADYKNSDGQNFHSDHQNFRSGELCFSLKLICHFSMLHLKRMGKEGICTLVSDIFGTICFIFYLNRLIISEILYKFAT